MRATLTPRKWGSQTSNASKRGFRGLHNKDYSISRSVFGSSHLGKLPNHLHTKNRLGSEATSEDGNDIDDGDGGGDGDDCDDGNDDPWGW